MADFDKMFDLGISARKDSKKAGVSYPILLHIFDTIRFTIVVEQIKTDHYGVSLGKFLLYIKEMKWRYNNRTWIHYHY